MKKITEKEYKDRIREIYLEEKRLFDKKRQLKEGLGDVALDTVQNALDFIGWIDPTPISDTINGFIYWNRGNRLFAFLTWISALPFIGDIAAKPVVMTLKNLKNAAKRGGGEEILGVSDDIVKQMENALDAGDVEEFTRLVDMNGGAMTDVVRNFDQPTILDSILQKLTDLKNVIKRIPFIGGLPTVIDEWTNVFTKASKQIKTSKEISDYYAKALKMGIKPLSDIDQKLLTQELNELNRFRGFSNYEPTNPNWWNRYYDGGFGKLYGNIDMRSLLQRTKWYLGLLDWLNVGNFVGPEELEKRVDNLRNEIEEYDQTEQAQQYAKEDLSEDLSVKDQLNQFLSQSLPSSPKGDSVKGDPISVLLSIVGM